MKRLQILTLISLLILSPTAISEESGFRLGIELGTGNVQVDAEDTILDLPNDDGFGVGWEVQYRWANNMVAALNFSSMSDDFLLSGLDHYSTYQASLMLGYALPLNDTISLVPMVGINDWEVKEQEGFILNPGPEDEIIFEGTDITAKVAVDVALSESWRLSLSYAYTDTDVGSISRQMFGLAYQF
ncbi:MAG: outer membrane beta-barrel protein [Alteromonadaceae bacterium]|nr:outer membrane beta-barrel protein [Alteromonadaceae bacterium]